jgi:hypothetical protein
MNYQTSTLFGRVGIVSLLPQNGASQSARLTSQIIAVLLLNLSDCKCHYVISQLYPKLRTHN